MHPSQKHIHVSVQSSDPNNNAPPLPRRANKKPHLKRNRNTIAAAGASNTKDGADNNTDSEYDYVANPAKKRNRSAIQKWAKVPGKTQQNGKYKDQGSVCQTSSSQDIHRQNEHNGGHHKKHIKQSMTSLIQKHAYQKLNKETMELSSLLCQKGLRTGEGQNLTIWTQQDYGLNFNYYAGDELSSLAQRLSLS